MTQSELIEKVIKGINLAIERLLNKKRKENSFVVISDKGKVVRVNAKDIKR